MFTTRNLLILGAALFAQNTIGGGFGALNDMQIQGRESRLIRSAQQQEQTRLTLSQDAVKQRDTIARERYEKGCVMVVASDDKTKLTAITEGLPVYDSARKIPLSAGNIVCDSNGLTGEIVVNVLDKLTPVVSNTAFTSDRAIVAAAMKRYQGTRYTMPSQK